MLSAELANAFARVALANVEREYPRRLDQLLVAPGTEWRPRVLHPAFYGSYDWHSAVHMHWLLALVLRLHAGIALSQRIESVFNAHFSPAAMAKEREFFDAPGGAIFERPYGWAWLLKLQAELARLGRWHDLVAPLASELARRLIHYVRSSPYPVRSGAHGNTAFACLLALDYAQAGGNAGLSQVIQEAARRWYFNDRNYPVAYEPSADDFLSPALVEAVLMKAVLPTAEFSAWLESFLPRDLGPLAHPPRVLNHADAKQSHLDGLCLSRAWCFAQLGKPAEARRHLEAGMAHVLGGDYVGEHWLASFAALALSAEAPKIP
ncbi:MAG TPA: DUF2891 domain-containing protein [Burkholderiales bacterium]|nr:DUF2891 domain-containing protein [Burkholderiales bacterium]